MRLWDTLTEGNPKPAAPAGACSPAGSWQAWATELGPPAREKWGWGLRGVGLSLWFLVLSSQLGLLSASGLAFLSNFNFLAVPQPPWYTLPLLVLFPVDCAFQLFPDEVQQL